MKDKIADYFAAASFQPLSKAKWNIYIIIIIRNAFNKLSIDRRRGNFIVRRGIRRENGLEVTRMK